MQIISIVLAVFWVLILIAAVSKLYQVVRYRQETSFRQWGLMVGVILIALWFLADKFLL